MHKRLVILHDSKQPGIRYQDINCTLPPGVQSYLELIKRDLQLWRKGFICTFNKELGRFPGVIKD